MSLPWLFFQTEFPVVVVDKPLLKSWYKFDTIFSYVILHEKKQFLFLLTFFFAQLTPSQRHHPRDHTQRVQYTDALRVVADFSSDVQGRCTEFRVLRAVGGVGVWCGADGEGNPGRAFFFSRENLSLKKKHSLNKNHKKISPHPFYAKIVHNFWVHKQAFHIDFPIVHITFEPKFYK